MAFVTPASVDQLKAAIRADYETVKAAVLAGNAQRKLDDQTLEEWDAMATRVDAYLRAEASWVATATQMNQGEALQRDLAAWHGRLARLGVPIGPAPETATPGILDSLQKGIAAVTDSPALLIAAIAVVLSWNKGRS